MERRIFGLENEYGVTCTLRGQRRLSPDEVARYLFRRVVSWGRSSNVFLQNGARQYLGRTAPLAAAATFLQNAQATSGPSAGGFPWFAGGDVDANSTALVLQAITAMGQSPSVWSVGGATPLAVLESFQLSSPASDAGSLFASWNPGVPDLLASYQGVWGLSLSAFPFPVLAGRTVVTEALAAPAFTG